MNGRIYIDCALESVADVNLFVSANMDINRIFNLKSKMPKWEKDKYSHKSNLIHYLNNKYCSDKRDYKN
jgi:hypothetical protein